MQPTLTYRRLAFAERLAACWAYACAYLLLCSVALLCGQHSCMIETYSVEEACREPDPGLPKADRQSSPAIRSVGRDVPHPQATSVRGLTGVIW
jgi:hypothetical protein